MKFETRRKVAHIKHEDGLPPEAYSSLPLVKVSDFLIIPTDVQAVCINDRWFFPTTMVDALALDEAWEDALK